MAGLTGVLLPGQTIPAATPLSLCLLQEWGTRVTRGSPQLPWHWHQGFDGVRICSFLLLMTKAWG